MTPAHSSDLRAWNRAAVAAFGDITVRSAVPRFEADMASRAWQGVRLVQVESPAATVSGACRGGQPGWFVLYNERGPCRVRQAARQTRLDDGELSLLRSDAPWEIDFGQPNRMLVAAVPWLDSPTALDNRQAVRHGRDQAAVLGALLHRLRGMEETEAARLDAHALRHALLDLLQLAQPDDGVQPPPGPAGRQSRWLERMAAIVRRDLASPTLDARAVAAELRISRRYVQLVFERQGSTLNAYILEQRLRRAAERLRLQPQARISDIALDAGFADLSYFCRSFRRRYGCTARQWRRGAQPHTPDR